MTTSRRTAAASLTLALALALGGCGGGTEPSAEDAAADAAGHNAADTEFTQMMIIHHEGAIEMSQLALERATTDEVRALAGRIEKAQDPEIELMRSWLEDWDEPAPEDADMDPMGHGGMDMDGMSQEEVMDELADLGSESFDARFLELMIAHHEGAIEMSQDHLEDGQNGDALELSEAIIDAQTTEIAEMDDLLAALG